MADPDPPNPPQQPPGVDRQALAAAHERRVANREFVDILTSLGSGLQLWDKILSHRR